MPVCTQERLEKQGRAFQKEKGRPAECVIGSRPPLRQRVLAIATKQVPVRLPADPDFIERRLRWLCKQTQGLLGVGRKI